MNLFSWYFLNKKLSRLCNALACISLAYGNNVRIRKMQLNTEMYEFFRGEKESVVWIWNLSGLSHPTEPSIVTQKISPKKFPFQNSIHFLLALPTQLWIAGNSWKGAYWVQSHKTKHLKVVFTLYHAPWTWYPFFVNPKTQSHLYKNLIGFFRKGLSDFLLPSGVVNLLS